jgi:anaerobic selenocysteine-containing dehydrogenase
MIHPDDASVRGWTDLDTVCVFNERGEGHGTLNVTVAIRSGSLPKGLWRRGTRNGFTAPALVPDRLTDLGGGACFNNARVHVASLLTA